MKRSPTVTLCISTYNWPQALELCLESVLLQTHMPDEVIIGDDGSRDETKVLIDAIKKKFPVPVIHVWQPDDGFRLAEIRNKSFAAATSEYIIQVDGDVVLNKYFIEDHLRFAKPETFLAGGRSMLTEEASKMLMQKKNLTKISKEYELKKKHNAFHFLPAAFINYYVQQGKKQAKYVLGVNMSFWKKDLVRVNGYNENFTGWGKEDNDLAFRLCNAGVNVHFLKFAGIVYHIHHKEPVLDKMQYNEGLLQQAILNKEVFVANGLSKYLK